MAFKIIVSLVIASLCVELISAQIIPTNPTRCVQCDSTNDAQGGLNCILAPADIPVTDCLGENNQTCFMRILNGGHTARGCLGSLSDVVREGCTPDANNPNSCQLCVNNNQAGGCNNFPFPIHRLHCHQCTGEVGTACAGETTTNPIACSLFNVGDQCFIRREGSTINRGCFSDFQECTPERCFRCAGNGCNNINGTHANVPEFSFANQNTANVMILIFAAIFTFFGSKY